MSLYVNLRYGAVGGGLRTDPYLIEGDGRVARPAMTSLTAAQAAARVAGRTVVFTVHGFNVSYDSGLRSLARIEDLLAAHLPSNFLMVGVLWPGDFIIPAINYPGEWRDAVDGGKALARFANTTLSGAADFCFLSHSLGGRLVLEAAAGLERQAARVCLTAAATDDDCLESPYDATVANSRALTYLASKKDMVLKLAYPIGDWAGDVFLGDKDDALRGALGRHGAQWPRTHQPKAWGFKVDEALDFGHGSYFPPSKPADQPKASHDQVARFAAAFLRGGSPVWPRLGPYMG
ncbi:MAG: alpha/beta hydrolase [Alphaproteobacteria bacterium]|nr:alpha/beta hydrolase [Alphaproteobacteria bacterium]